MINLLVSRNPSHHFTKMKSHNGNTTASQYAHHLSSASNNLNGLCPSKLIPDLPKLTFLTELGPLPRCTSVEREKGSWDRYHQFTDSSTLLQSRIQTKTISEMAEQNLGQFTKLIKSTVEFSTQNGTHSEFELTPSSNN